MARKARVEYAGAVDHVLERGDRREPIFQDDADRRRFLETLGEVCRRTGWRVQADVLLTDDDHFLLETPEASLVAGMRWFQTTWTMSEYQEATPFFPVQGDETGNGNPNGGSGLQRSAPVDDDHWLRDNHRRRRIQALVHGLGTRGEPLG